VCSKVIAALPKHLQLESDTAIGLAGFVVFMQRFVSAGNLNVHLHIIALDESLSTLKPHERDHPERVVRLIARQSISDERLIAIMLIPPF
jgi:hypothetical protein